MDVSIGTIILAAGSGTRIGIPKILLKSGGKYFPDIISDNLLLSGINNISAVISEGIDITRFLNSKKISWVVNPNPELGMISSVYEGVNSLPGKDGFLIIPVDHPKIFWKTFRNLQNTFRENSESVVIAAYRGVPGHPLILPKSIAYNIEKKDYPNGLRGIIQSSGVNIVYVDTDDAGVLKNVNTKSDFTNL